MSVVLIVVRDGVAQDFDLRGGGVHVGRDGTVTRIPESSIPAFEARLAAVESRLDRILSPGGSSEESLAKAAADLAYARRLNAEAEKLERENAAAFGAPADDGGGPVEVQRWDIESRSDLGTVRARLSDRRGREYALTLLPGHARDLAEQLLGGARFVDARPGSA